jgi:hypothetical protein
MEEIMSRQFGAIIVGVVIAVAVIYALFDRRVSFRELAATPPAAHSVN